MTTQSTTTKEALEPCPLCRKPLTELTNGLAYCHNLKTDSLSVDDWIAESCQLAQRSVQLPMKVWHALNSRISAPIVAPEVDDEFTDSDLTLIEATAEAAGSDEIARLAGYAKRLRESLRTAPASTVAPLCLHQCDYGGMPRCSLPAGHEGTHDYTNAPASPAAPISSEAWTEWFNRLGAKASAEVVNATADLVTNERLAALVQAKVLPDPAALRDEAQVERHDILGALNHSRTICLHNAQDQSKSSEYRLMMEHFAEAGRQIIEMITEGRHKNLSRLVLE